MGGSILRTERGLYRFGQDFTAGYGDGLIVFKIDALGETEYRESLAGPIRFREVRGPHTLNFQKGVALFDWYRDSFSILAGVRRLKGRLG
jgi:hypothetical protein